MTGSLPRAFATVLLALAACAPVRPAAAPREAPPDTGPDAGRVYTIDQVTTPPAFTNLGDMVRMMSRNHPPLLRDAARGGIVVMMVEVGRDGRVRDARVLRSSGDAGMDAAAVRAASSLRARPARVGDTSVAVRVEIPFEFGVGP